MTERRVLIVSPHFPPVNAPDMQRVRMSLPYFHEFGWRPFVLTVAPDPTGFLDPLLAETIPSDVTVERVPSMPKAFGVGNIAARALPFLYRTGARLIAEHRIDVVYFSTTMFLSMPLGRLWRRRFGVPYVLDIQDPWFSDYYDQHPDSSPPPKYALAQRLHAKLEPWTMREASAIIAVSDTYLMILKKRYPWLTDDMCTVLPFGVSSSDFRVLDSHPQQNPYFRRPSPLWHGVYTGVVGDFMAPALRILLGGVRDGLVQMPELFDRIRLHFIGTDYATDDRARKRVEPIATSIGVERFIDEHTSRVPYFQALQLVRDADCLFVIGSDDPAYVASMLHPYVFARKPIVAIVHADSPMVPLLRQAGALVVPFSPGAQGEREAMDHLVRSWPDWLGDRPLPPQDLPPSFEAYSARELTRRQCAVFDRVLHDSFNRSAAPCTN